MEQSKWLTRLIAVSTLWICGVVKRNVELLWRIAHEFFRPGEMLTHRFDPDGLGVQVGVCNTGRPGELLRAINKEAFRNFAFLGVTFDGRMSWTHFRAM